MSTFQSLGICEYISHSKKKSLFTTRTTTPVPGSAGTQTLLLVQQAQELPLTHLKEGE